MLKEASKCNFIKLRTQSHTDSSGGKLMNLIAVKIHHTIILVISGEFRLDGGNERRLGYTRRTITNGRVIYA